MELVEIGHILSDYKCIENCPPNGWSEKIESNIYINNEFIDGTEGMYVGEVIHVLWWFDKAPRNVLKNYVDSDKYETGVFSMRSPHRPNPIALSLCRITKIEKNVLTVIGLEALDGSVVVDIKKAIEYEGVVL
ncbi:tRNA-Thr(GGU) m(6)t(6)A37 methyltransferase TsaA [Lachnospiraceae bacterium A10]|nr:tRNA-Thr(GGU) m(6)t(6)A37 methyltransferase TsaA [Lachnospiraceae bacterium A10]